MSDSGAITEIDFVYDIASEDALIASVSEIRLQIGDSVDGEGPRPDGRNFSNAEINSFLTREGGHIQRTTALALEVLAAEWSKEASRQQLGPASSEANQARAYGERAAILRSAYGFNTPSYQTGSTPGSATSAYIDWSDFYANGGL
jgi:hypothetical protein